MATLFVNEKAHPAAKPYYKTFISEPTKNGKPITIQTFVEMHKNNEWCFPKLLEKIKDKCQNDRDILIVSHGGETGLLLPMRLNTKNYVTKDHLDKIVSFGTFINDQQKKKDISTKKKISEKLKKKEIDKIDKDIEKKTKEIAGICKISTKELNKISDLRNDVLKLNLQQIEIRACNVGKNNATLYSFMTFFGAQSIGAPDIFSAFGYIECGPYANRHSRIWYNFRNRYPGGRDNFTIKSGIVYLARYGRKNTRMACIAESKSTLQEWLSKCLPHTSKNINLKRFPRCHLNTMRKDGTFIFPKEGGYLPHIKVCTKGMKNPKTITLGAGGGIVP